MSAGTIGGIIGGVVGGLALFALAVFLWKKWRSRAEREQYPLPCVAGAFDLAHWLTG
jgi:hypothetical protein